MIDLQALRGRLNNAADDLWLRGDMEHDRSWQAELGVSAVGGCERQAGYILTRTPMTDSPAPGRAALMGTWLHERILPLLADSLGGCEVEGEMRIEGDLLGHSDLYAQIDETVLDLKTGTEATISNARKRGPKRRQKWQVMLYAKGRRDRGEIVTAVAILFIDRARGEHYLWVAPYDEGMACEALGWLHDVRVVAARNVELLTRTGRGPVLDVQCDSCKWLTRCWPDAQATIVTEGGNSAVESALALYEAGADQEAAGKADKEFGRAILEGTPEGVYGPYKLAWQSTGARLDQTRAKELLLAAGIAPPMNPAGKRAKVTRAT